MIKKWSLKSKSLLLKAGLALGVIGITYGVVIGSMIGYADNSAEKNGEIYPINKNLFDNDYSKIYDQEGNLNPELSITNGTKTRITGKISSDATKFSFLNSSKEYNFDEFFKEYYDRFNEPFVLEIKYGSFSFFDEYVLAVRPKQFLEFTNWFISNVAWGPDLLTLDSFRLVPGVEQNGNAITLGSHSTLHKEVSEIKFFPDAFFGSLPIHSTIAGPGNATDSLAYSVFSNVVSKADLDQFLANIGFESALKNDVQRNMVQDSVGEIYRTNKLVNKTYKVALGSPQGENNPNVYPSAIFVKSDFAQADLDALKTQYPSLADLTLESFQDYQVKQVNVTPPANNQTEPTLNLTLAKPGEEAAVTAQINLNTLNNNKYISYKTLLASYQDNISSYLNFYDMDAYKDSTFYLYNDDNNNKHFYNLFVQAINENPELKALKTTEEQQAKVKQYKVLDFEKTTNAQTQAYTLKVNIQQVLKDNQEGEMTSLEFVANKANDFSPEGFDDFVEAIGYQGGIDPVSLFYTPTDIQARDEQGNLLTGLASRSYQLYVSVYNNLIKKVVKKYPHLLRQLDGPHVKQTVDANGVFQYELAEGPFQGFTPSDRIGLPIILSTLVPGFDGLPIDFLKYVATHEYGHHYTLDQGQAFIDKDNPVIVGGLSTRGGANAASFYSYQALINYLNARSNLEVIRVNANNEVTNTGKFIRFRFGIIDESGNVIRYETERLEDIWGTTDPNDSITNVLKNKKRRFLQDFSGLTEAAKLRNVKLSDLFYANSFDADSGTINPSISGLARAFAKSQANGTVSEYKWTPVTSKSIVSQLTDGAGNPLLGKAVMVSDNDELTFKIFETDPQNSKIITKINMFNKDGTPVIQVPLNVELSDAELAYVSQQADVIANTIRSSIIKNLSDNGWNTPSTVLGGEISSSIGSVFGGEGVTDLVNKIKTRTQANEFNPGTNNFNASNVRSGFSYLSFENSLSLQLLTLISNVISWNSIDDAVKAGTWVGTSDRYIRSDANKIVVVQKSGSSSINDLNSFDKYVFPYVKGNVFLGNISNADDDGLIGRVNSIASSNQLTTTDGLYNLSFTRSLITALRALAGGNAYQSSFISYVKQDSRSSGTSSSTNSYTLEGTLNLLQRIRTAIRNGNGNSTTIAQQIQTIDNETSLVVNPFGTDLGNLDRQLLNAVKDTNKIQVSVSTNSSSQKMSTFNSRNLSGLLDFVSIDYSKAKYDTTKKQYNWDVSYVENKFNLDNVSKISTDDNSPEAAKLKEAITAAGQNSAAKKQAQANYAMYLFRHSNLFMSVKDFSPVTNLVANRAVFSELYGVTMLDQNFNKYYVEDLTDELNDGIHFDTQRLQKYFEKFVKDNKLDSVKDRISFHDLLILVGNIVYYGNNGNVPLQLDSFIFGHFSPGLSSDDVLNYNATRVEPLLNDKFTDYVFNIAEALTRDYVQTTYVPNTKDFENTPKFLTGLSEAMSGLDYIVDATNINHVNDTKVTQAQLSRALQTFRQGKLTTTYYDKLIVAQVDAVQNFRDAVDAYSAAIDNYNTVAKENNNNQDAQPVVEALAKMKDAEQKVTEAQKALDDLRAQTRQEVFGNGNNFFQDREQRTSTYFGQFISKNNGFFKDNFEKATIGAQLYDDNLDPIIDNNIRTVDFKGNKVNKRPEAFFLSQLYNYGVSRRTVSGLFRNERLDALALYGYVPIELANKIGYLRFTNTQTNEVLYLKVNTKKTNNIFWLQKQGDPNSKKTLEDYGYASWLSDYALMGKYRNTLLRPGNTYTVDFVDKDRNFLQAVDLGDAQYISENAKAVEQSPVKIENKNTTDGDNKQIKTVISVDFQFNVTN